MPNVAGREFPYTPQGMAAAEQYKQSLGMRGGGMMGFRPVGYAEGDLVESPVAPDDPTERPSLPDTFDSMQRMQRMEGQTQWLMDNQNKTLPWNPEKTWSDYIEEVFTAAEKNNPGSGPEAVGKIIDEQIRIAPSQRKDWMPDLGPGKPPTTPPVPTPSRPPAPGSTLAEEGFEERFAPPKKHAFGPETWPEQGYPSRADDLWGIGAGRLVEQRGGPMEQFEPRTPEMGGPIEQLEPMTPEMGGNIPPWVLDPRYKGYFNPNQPDPFFNPNEIEVANGGYVGRGMRHGGIMSLRRR